MKGQQKLSVHFDIDPEYAMDRPFVEGYYTLEVYHDEYKITFVSCPALDRDGKLVLSLADAAYFTVSKEEPK